MPSPEIRLPATGVPRELSGVVAALRSMARVEVGLEPSGSGGIVLANGERQARSLHEATGGRTIWIERGRIRGAQSGAIHVLTSAGDRRHPFQALSSRRFWNDPEVFGSTAARRIVDLMARPDDAPWPPPPDVVPPAAGGLWKTAFERPRWGLGLLDSQGARSLRRRPGTTLADPFPLVRDDREWVFFEEQSPGEPGRIAVAAMDGESMSEIVERLDLGPTHRSWPNVFSHGGDLWMLPESSADGEVCLWRCTSFPGAWTKERILLAGAAWTDPVLFEHDGLWWLFVAGAGPSPHAHSDSLHLFHSPDPWRVAFTPHPWNPVSVGVVGSRPAGRLFLDGDRLVRPAQDCSYRYGRALVFWSIDRLTPREYAESFLRRVDPPGTRGMHTWNQGRSGVFVDLLGEPKDRGFLARR